MKLRMIGTLGAIGIAAIALIGAGAHAVFTSQTASTQTITAGTMNVVLSSTCTQSGDGTANLTLTSMTDVGSSFMTSPCLITIHNDGTVAVNEVAVQLTDSNNNGTFQGETWACFYSDGAILANEPLTTVEGYGQTAVAGPIPVGGTDSYTVVFYAGPSEDTGCGAAYAHVGGAYNGFPSSYTASEPYPQSPGTNPAAATLTNGAEGGTLIPTFTFTYQG